MIVWPVVAVVGFVVLAAIVIALATQSRPRSTSSSATRCRRTAAGRRPGRGRRGRWLRRRRRPAGGGAVGSAGAPTEEAQAVAVSVAAHPAGKRVAGQGTPPAWWLVDDPDDGSGERVVAGPFRDRIEADWAALSGGLAESGRAVHGVLHTDGRVVRRQSEEERAWLSDLGDQLDRLPAEWDGPLADEDELVTLVVEVAGGLVEAGLALHDCAGEEPAGGVCLTPEPGRPGVLVSWHQHARMANDQVHGASGARRPAAHDERRDRRVPEPAGLRGRALRRVRLLAGHPRLRHRRTPTGSGGPADQRVSLTRWVISSSCRLRAPNSWTSRSSASIIIADTPHAGCSSARPASVRPHPHLTLVRRALLPGDQPGRVEPLQQRRHGAGVQVEAVADLADVLVVAFPEGHQHQELRIGHAQLVEHRPVARRDRPRGAVEREAELVVQRDAGCRDAHVQRVVPNPMATPGAVRLRCSAGVRPGLDDGDVEREVDREPAEQQAAGLGGGARAPPRRRRRPARSGVWTTTSSCRKNDQVRPLADRPGRRRGATAGCAGRPASTAPTPPPVPWTTKLRVNRPQERRLAVPVLPRAPVVGRLAQVGAALAPTPRWAAASRGRAGCAPPRRARPPGRPPRRARSRAGTGGSAGAASGRSRRGCRRTSRRACRPSPRPGSPPPRWPPCPGTGRSPAPPRPSPCPRSSPASTRGSSWATSATTNRQPSSATAAGRGPAAGTDSAPPPLDAHRPVTTPPGRNQDRNRPSRTQVSSQVQPLAASSRRQLLVLEQRRDAGVLELLERPGAGVGRPAAPRPAARAAARPASRGSGPGARKAARISASQPLEHRRAGRRRPGAGPAARPAAARARRRATAGPAWVISAATSAPEDSAASSRPSRPRCGRRGQRPPAGRSCSATASSRSAGSSSGNSAGSVAR